ncbi:Mucolipin-3 [Oopsacas minuta]|uniref:Mucolipin-3 n=1 Tax=Oopsacas minuta TaxID=111878 RepID=A0AAV7JYC6_9METZ|nr:Mucolipin-3 [Oopsacas minuta]
MSARKFNLNPPNRNPTESSLIPDIIINAPSVQGYDSSSPIDHRLQEPLIKPDPQSMHQQRVPRWRRDSSLLGNSLLFCCSGYKLNSSQETSIPTRSASHQEEIDKMRQELQFHFMNPFEKMKYRERRRMPWKLIFQILQVLAITIQLWTFSQAKFNVASFLSKNSATFNRYFILGYSSDPDEYAIYTVDDLQSSITHAIERYYCIQNKSLGPYDYSLMNGTIPLIELCLNKYKSGIIYSFNHSYDFDSDTEDVCHRINQTNILESVAKFINPLTLDSLILTKLSFSLSSVYLKAWPNPDCVIFDISINYDHSDHDGRVPVCVKHEYETIDCINLRTNSNDQRFVSANPLNQYGLYDCVIILLCLATSFLCLRSIFRTLTKAIRVKRFFIKHFSRSLNVGELWPMFNIWFIGLVIGNFFAILGSFWKIMIEHKILETKQFDLCSLMLGVGVLFGWCSMLRFFSYFEKYNILLLTLRLALPNVIRFIICILIVYIACCLVGWVILGPYHSKFRDVLTTSECLFSLLNGDDMYNTFQELRSASIPIRIFCEIYLYVFISLFIYVVLSLFISLISETYENLKHGGRLFAFSLLEQFAYCTDGSQIFIGGQRCDSTGNCQAHLQNSNQFNNLAPAGYQGIDPNNLSNSNSHMAVPNSMGGNFHLNSYSFVKAVNPEPNPKIL